MYLEVNSVWIKGIRNRNKVVNALLESDYDVRVSIDRESESLFGEPLYLISFVNFTYDRVRFVAIDEQGNILEGEREDF